MEILTRSFKYQFLKFKRLRGDPSSLARGVALGTFIGISPTIPLHTILIVILSFPFRASKISSLLTSLIVSNPVTFFFQYFLSWYLGNLLIPGTLSREKLNELLALITSEANFMEIVTEFGILGFRAVSVLLLGGIIIATPFTISSYFVSLKFFRAIAQKRAERIARQRTRELLSGHKEDTEAS